MLLCLALGLQAGCMMHCAKPNAAGRVPWQSDEPIDHWQQRMAELQALDPEATARAMFARDQIVFAGINGLGGNYPEGVQLTDSEDCRYPVVEVEGTSDTTSIGPEDDFVNTAYRFAVRFNREMLRLVRER